MNPVTNSQLAALVWSTIIFISVGKCQRKTERESENHQLYLSSLISYMWLLALIGKLCSVVFFFGAWWFYVPPSKDNKKDPEILD